MGLDLLSFLKTKVSRDQKYAFTSTFFISLLIHLYKFVNTLPNPDSLYCYYSDQNILGSGRWALSLACGFSSYFDLPWIIGLVSCVFIALTVAVIVTIFKVENPVLITLIGGLLAASPSTTETFFYQFTADGYMIAMFLAALAVYLSRIDEERKFNWVLSGVCVCVSCGIYQSYVSFALILAIFYFVYELFENRHERKAYIAWIGRQVCIFACSLAAYYIIWKLCMRISGISANDYQGISEVGTISVDLLLGGLINSIEPLVLYFLQWNVLEHGFTLYSVLNLLFAVAFCIGFLIAIKESKILSRRWAFFLLLLCGIAIIPFAFIWNFVSGAVVYRPMMLHCLVLLFVFAALIYERWAKKYMKNIIGALMLIIVVNNALIANISYFYMNLSYERTYADGLEMMMEIRDLQDSHEIEKIAIVGERLEKFYWENIDEETGAIMPAGQIQLMSSKIRTNMLFNHEYTVRFLEGTFGLDLDWASATERWQLAQSEEVSGMPCWPEAGSMCVLGDTVVIKFADSE